ncbi:hypothetical protein [Streptomyces hypolithicus]
MRELAFTGPGEVVACAMNGGLSRWRSAPHEALTLAAVGKAPRLSSLCAIAAWGVLAGYAGSEGRHYFFDPVTLHAADAPRPLTEAGHQPEAVRTVAASADGRFAAVGAHAEAGGFILTVHDFHHPLARLLSPVGSLTGDDFEAIGRAAETFRHGTQEREALELLRDAGAQRPGAQESRSGAGR